MDTTGTTLATVFFVGLCLSIHGLRLSRVLTASFLCHFTLRLETLKCLCGATMHAVTSHLTVVIVERSLTIGTAWHVGKCCRLSTHRHYTVLPYWSVTPDRTRSLPLGSGKITRTRGHKDSSEPLASGVASPSETR